MYSFNIEQYKRDKQNKTIKRVIGALWSGIKVCLALSLIYIFLYAYLIISHAVFNQ